MKVSKIELYHISIPLPGEFYPSWIPGYPQKFNRSTLLKITTDDGIVGYSAGMAMEEEREGLGSLLGQYLIGQDVEKLDEVNHLLREASYLGWRNNWIEAAFWDILGKKEGKPVYELLGGKVEKSKPTAQQVKFMIRNSGQRKSKRFGRWVLK